MPDRPQPSGEGAVAQLGRRARDVLRQIVEGYMESGEPMGSRTIARMQGQGLSAATIRNTMADLEEAGLLYQPHTSAGRLPTDLGMRFFVDGLLEVGRLTEDERAEIDSRCVAAGKSAQQVLEQASTSLAGLSHHAGVVVAPKAESPLKHIEFLALSPGRALVVLVTENGRVENRIIDVPVGIPASALVEASNYLSQRIVGRSFAHGREQIARELAEHRAQIDALTADLIARGLAEWGGQGKPGPGGNALIVRGSSKLLDDVTALADLERVRRLFDALETRETMGRLLDMAERADGVKIFIGAENDLFRNTGCSMILSPYKNANEKVVGCIGVIGPRRMNYARIIPMVDYTAKVVGRILG